MLIVFGALTPIAISGGDFLGIAVCLSGVALIAGIVTYQLQKIYFTLTQKALLFGKDFALSGADILSYTVFESRGQGEGYFTCLNVNIKLKEPLAAVNVVCFENRKWAKLSNDYQEILISLPETSASAAKVSEALATLKKSQKTSGLDT